MWIPHALDQLQMRDEGAISAFLTGFTSVHVRKNKELNAPMSSLIYTSMYLGFWRDVSMPIRIIPTNSIRTILAHWLKCTCWCQSRARQRRRLQAHERLARDRRQAQRTAEALSLALEERGLPANLVVEIEGRLRRQHQLLGQLIGVMFPALFGCRTPSELCRVRGWDKQWPSRMLGAWPKRSWLKRLRRLGQEGLAPLWRHVHDKSPATQSPGHGRGCAMIPCSKNMGHRGDAWVQGGAASISVSCLALMDSYSWWSWAMGAWSSQGIVPCDGLTRWGLGHRAGTS